MKVTISIACDNAAFEDNPFELSDILKDLGSRIRCAGHIDDAVTIRDSNGNDVGSIVITY